MSNSDDVWATPPEGTQMPAQPATNSPYGAPAYGPANGYVPIAPKHPQATTAMVLGIIGLVGGFLTGIGFLAAPFAWAIGGRAVKQIDAAPMRTRVGIRRRPGRSWGSSAPSCWYWRSS